MKRPTVYIYDKIEKPGQELGKNVQKKQKLQKDLKEGGEKE